MADYYNYVRIGHLFNIVNDPGTVFYNGTPYYRQVIDITRKCIHVLGFPTVNAKQIYDTIFPENKPTMEACYQTYQWKCIWKNLCSLFILPKERQVLFKFLHEVLPIKKRLKEILKSAMF